MKQLFLSLLSACALAALPFAARAEKGAPHTFRATTAYGNVALSWLSPEQPNELKWHNDDDYDGDSGLPSSPQRAPQIYVSSVFKANELTDVAGQQIVAVKYFEYRPVLSVTAIIWADGKIVAEKQADLKTPAFKQNTYRTITLDTPYTIPAGAEVRVGLRIEHGTNMDFVAIMDRACDARGDLYSTDGKRWQHNGRGTYLVSAVLANPADECPDGFNIWADGQRVNAESLAATTTAYTLTAQPDGRHTYEVEAVYGAEGRKSVAKTLDVRGLAAAFPAVSSLAATTDGTHGTLRWTAPLLPATDGALTWTTGTQANKIGGTASSNTKVWVRNTFNAADLVAFAGGKLTAVEANFAEAVVQSAIVWAMRDGVFVQRDTIPAADIAAIQAGTWTRLPFSEPVTIEAGHDYAYGYYIMHEPKTHPVSVDNGEAIGSKGNSFSTSSPNSKDFMASKPTWKTLAEGGIAGNWMLKADVEAATTYTATTHHYNVLRDGATVAEGLTSLTFADDVPAPGRYVYAVEAVGSNGNVSEPYELITDYTIPAAYRAPLITNARYDEQTDEAAFDWNMDVELKHYGTATYMVGFDEEMTMAWGSRFTAAELAPYQGYRISKLNFAIAEELPDGFTLEVSNTKGEKLATETIAAGEVTPLAFYSLTLKQPVEITGDDDLVIAYRATIPGGVSPILLDEGPRVEGGAVVNLAGKSWINLGTINASYNNYNIVIGAVAEEAAPAGAPKRSVELGSTLSGQQLAPATPLRAAAARECFGIGAATAAAAPQRSAALSPATYNVWRDGELVASTAARSYRGTLPTHDTHTFTVSAVYANGWESEQSAPAIIANPVAQLDRAPYYLRPATDGDALVWDDEDTAPALTYAKPGISYGVGMTGSGTRETYAVQKFPADSLKGTEGAKITHVKFALYTTDLKSAAIVIFRNLNIAYEQPVAVADLKAITDGQQSYNVVRLNEPFVITPGDDIMVGYHITYANGVKPMIYDEGPADDKLGNLLSASASHTSWKSLKSLSSKMDGNWRIYAYLETPATRRLAPAAAAAAVTYNVYRDGAPCQQGLAEHRYEPAGGLAAGTYTVTAVKDGQETAPSNPCTISTTGLDGTHPCGAQQAAEAARYNAAGQAVDRDAKGMIIVKHTDGTAVKQAR